MDYGADRGGRVAADASVDGRVAGFLTFDAVEERLIEAMELWRRAPDRERGWLAVRSHWPEIKRHGFFGDGDGEINHAEEKPEPRALPLTRAEVAEMDAVGEWMRHVPEQDRRLVTIVLRYLARDVQKVPWLRIWDRLGRGRPGPDGLRKRYSRAIAGIAKELSR